MSLNIPVPWDFNEAVAKHFGTHVRQSIPGYEEMHSLFADAILSWRDGPIVMLDVGTGTGESISLLGHSLKKGDTITGIDRSHAMLKQARRRDYGVVTPIFQCADITNTQIPRHNVTVLAFTLSFITPNARSTLIQSLKARNSGGILLLSDKIAFTSKEAQAVIQERHDRFKADRGIAPEDIALKKEGLRGVMWPETLQGYISLLCESGWLTVDILYVSDGFFCCICQS